MNVHVPQTGDEELSSAINDLRSRKHFDLFRPAHISEVVPDAHYGHILLDYRGGGIDQCYVCEYDGRF
jgi:hypothetical protein